MEYETRHMEALKPMHHMGESLLVGECFYASAVDAGYYVKHGRAREIAMPASMVGLSESVDKVVDKVIEPVQEQPAVDTTPVESPVVDEAAAQEQPADPVMTMAPRRGRPPKAVAPAETTDPQA